MNKNYVFGIVAIVVVLALGAIFIINNPNANTNNAPANENNFISSNENSQIQGEVKEFAMDSFYEIIDGQPKPQYSLKEITVKKGDTVKIQVTVTKGDHDFNIDEYNIHTETPLNQPTVVEFKADKAGEFVYYCSRTGHRQNGQWGTLKIIE